VKLVILAPMEFSFYSAFVIFHVKKEDSVEAKLAIFDALFSAIILVHRNTMNL
jgi:hypothetical protein